ncbi:hypothetical protein LINGRAHAP2_LOCUS762 [Linum grandiflorum]
MNLKTIQEFVLHQRE